MTNINNVICYKPSKIMCVLLCIIFGFTSIISYSQDIAFTKVTAGNLREKPDGKIIMQLPYGTELKIINEDGLWYEVQINVDSIQGFIHKSIISLTPLVASGYNSENIFRLELTSGRFEDNHVIREHERTYGYEELIRPANEQFERLLYHNKNLSSKHYIFNMAVLAERMRRGTYLTTPIEIFNQSEIYNLSNEVYNNEPITTPTKREFKKPPIKESYFNTKPDKYLISNIKERQDSLFFGNYLSSPKLIHILRIYFEEENSFHLLNKEGALVYTSSQKVRFFTTDERGENMIENTGVITYQPEWDWHSEICVTDLSIPYNEKMFYIYFCAESLMDRHLQHEIEITKTTQTINEWFEFDVFEFDFNNDGVVDMLRSFELCPDEAADSADEVYYFNVNGKWEPMLVTRTWCNP